jgi:hypothetical protein
MSCEINRFRLKLTQLIYIKSMIKKSDSINIGNDFILTNYQDHILDRILKGKESYIITYIIIIVNYNFPNRSYGKQWVNKL